MSTRTIGQLASAAGVAIDTIRYYERIGLLPRRGESGGRWHRYPEETLVRLRYLREGRAVGFTLRELRALLDLVNQGRPKFCESFDGAVNRKISAIEQLIASLVAQRVRLREFSDQCRKRRQEHRCPILEALRPAQEGMTRAVDPRSQRRRSEAAPYGRRR
jgi:DNA-binding transcriptional MerR regulator